MEFIDDADEFARRLPLMAGPDFLRTGRSELTEGGTDVDFGALSGSFASAPPTA